jgi:hypothetical protein
LKASPIGVDVEQQLFGLNLSSATAVELIDSNAS